MRRAFHHRPRKKSMPTADPRREMRSKDDRERDDGVDRQSRSQVIRFAIHFQADQQPSAAPSISSGAVQKNARVRISRRSNAPTNTPISIGVTTIQPRTPICDSRRATEGSPSFTPVEFALVRSRTSFSSGSSSAWRDPVRS